MISFFVVGEDKRSKYLREMYEKEGKIVDSVDKADYVISAIPFTKDKIHITSTDVKIEDFLKNIKNKTLFSSGVSQEFLQKFEENNIKYIDVMASDYIAYLNAIPTAEGAIYKAMEYTDFVLHNANVLVLGFGRVGKILASKLKGLNANVFCEARNKKDLAHIEGLGYNVVELKNLDSVLGKMDIIFSTIPYKILDLDRLRKINKDTVIIDLASLPGSIDYDTSSKLNIKAYLELGIPAKIAPKTASEYLKSVIDSSLR